MTEKFVQLAWPEDWGFPTFWAELLGGGMLVLDRDSWQVEGEEKRAWGVASPGITKEGNL